MRSPKVLAMAQLLAILMMALGAVSFARDRHSRISETPKGPTKTIVHPKFGGVIFGFDVDQNGREGLFSEAVVNGNSDYATETFDLATGKIIKVVRHGKPGCCGDDDVTWGVVGTSVGLVEHQHSPRFDDLQITYRLLNPLSGNQVTGPWSDPEKKTAEIIGASRTQGASTNAFQVFNFATQLEYVYGSNVAQNTFGPVVQVASTPGIIGLNTKTNRAVVAVGDGNGFGATNVTQVDMASGAVTSFLGLGSGIVQGLAVDSEDDIAVTTTFADAGVEFYDLKTQAGFELTLPFIPQNCDDACAGFDVEFDPIHKLFLVAQPISSQQANSNFSTIYVYNRRGDLLETLNGFNFFTQRFDVFPVHIALHPSDRSGYVDVTNNVGVGAIQRFTY